MTRTSKSRALNRAIGGLQRLVDLFLERREQLAAEAGLTVAQWRVLEKVAGEDFMPSLFAKRRAQSPAAVSKLLRQLQNGGWLRSSIGARDARTRRYDLTREGRRLLEALRRSRATAIASVWADLPARDLERFADFSEQLGERLEEHLDPS